jgi:hypothetical protein
VIDGEVGVTVKETEAESVVLPVTVIVYTPAGAVDVTVKEPDTEPLLENVHVAVVTIVVGELVTHA